MDTDNNEVNLRRYVDSTWYMGLGVISKNIAHIPQEDSAKEWVND